MCVYNVYATFGLLVLPSLGMISFHSLVTDASSVTRGLGYAREQLLAARKIARRLCSLNSAVFAKTRGK